MVMLAACGDEKLVRNSCTLEVECGDGTIQTWTFGLCEEDELGEQLGCPAEFRHARTCPGGRARECVCIETGESCRMRDDVIPLELADVRPGD